MELPDPLHPAVIHFPIVLILLGAGASVFALFIRGWHLPKYTALLLVLGVAGVFVALNTGEKAEHEAKPLTLEVHEIVEEHEHWADRTRNAVALAAVLAVVSAFLGRGMIARGVALLAAIVALTAAYCVYETARHGGELVYENGIGVKKLVRPAAAVAPITPAAPAP